MPLRTQAQLQWSVIAKCRPTWHVEFEIFTTVITNITKFWDARTFSTVEFRLFFGGTLCFHLQSRRVCQLGNKKEASSMQSEPHMENMVRLNTGLDSNPEIIRRERESDPLHGPNL
jgi:hypothetical protein